MHHSSTVYGTPSAWDGIGTLSSRLLIGSESGPRGTARLPTYEYRCKSCDQNFDVVQSFHDDPLTACPTCGAPVRKVFGNVGIVFKGSGFYKNDSRNGSSAKPSEGGASAPASDSGSKGSESGPRSRRPRRSNGALIHAGGLASRC